MSAPGSLFQDARLRIKVRAQELYEVGATRDQAYFMALEEAWKYEVAENARLWDQANEIAALQAENARLRRYVAVVASGMPRDKLLRLEIEFGQEGFDPSMIRDEDVLGG